MSVWAVTQCSAPKPDIAVYFVRMAALAVHQFNPKESLYDATMTGRGDSSLGVYSNSGELMSQENVGVVRRLFKAVEERDLAGVLAAYDPDCHTRGGVTTLRRRV